MSDTTKSGDSETVQPGRPSFGSSPCSGRATRCFWMGILPSRFSTLFPSCPRETEARGIS
jgi:hypothetical protein